MKKRILILGYFGYITNQLDGQTVKTRYVYELLKKKSKFFESVNYFDSQSFQFNKLSFFNMIWRIFRCQKLIYLPATKNLTYIFPIIYLICKLRRVDTLYVVVGGWLAEYLENKALHAALLSRIRAIFPENKHLKEKLEKKYGFRNVHIFPNFRMHSFTPSFYQEKNSFKIVFMARINRMKGIDATFRLAEQIEKKHNQDSPIEIDFYGPIDEGEEGYFKQQIDKFDFVTYRGILQPDEIYDALGQYDVSILPTHYPGEGFPGTIVDSYASGLPVIVSNWKYLPEVVDHGITGYVFDLKNENEFYEYVDKLYRDRALLLRMKKNAFEKSKIFSAENAWGIIKSYLTA